MKLRFLKKLILLGWIGLLASCSVQNLQTSAKRAAVKRLDNSLIDNTYQYKIKKDDKLTVSIWNHDDLSVGSSFGIYNSNEVYGKWVMVDNEGKVGLPQVGEVHVEGLTISQAKDTLTALYAKHIVDPVLIVKVLNMEISVLGEVKSPASYVVDKNRNNFLDVISKAGGFDFYANKKKISILRNQEDGQIKTIHLDLTKMDAAVASTILLVPGDVVYVPTRKGKMLDKKSPSVVPFTSIITALAIIFKFF